jgi:hypothetical protein
VLEALADVAKAAAAAVAEATAMLDKKKTNLNILIRTGVVFLVTGWGIMMDSWIHLHKKFLR